MANLLKGKEVADAINLESIERVNKLKDKRITPTLAILRVGKKDSDLSYERGALKRCAQVGVEVKVFEFEEDVESYVFYKKLDEINLDPSIHGILIFRPLPKQFNDEELRNHISPLKDVDGCTDSSLGSIFLHKEFGCNPCTAQAVIEILDHYKIDIAGKNVAVIGRSLVIGKPVSMMLLNRNATVTICHSKTKDIPSISRNADIVIAAIGKMESLTKDYFSENQTVIDVGINYNEAKQKLCGDVLFEEVEPLVANITPVPGGVGSVTTSVLVKHVIDAAEK